MKRLAMAPVRHSFTDGSSPACQCLFTCYPVYGAYQALLYVIGGTAQMERRPARHWKLGRLALAFVLVLITPTLALGTHYHAAGEWNHGIGDGHDNDYYVVPNQYPNTNHTHEQRIELQGPVWDGSWSAVRAAYCGACRYIQIEYDTNPVFECRYRSRHRSFGSHALNDHNHYHHNSC